MLTKGDSGGFAALERLFENLPELITPKTVEEVFGPKVKTVYDWHYRGELRRVLKGSSSSSTESSTSVPKC